MSFALPHGLHFVQRGWLHCNQIVVDDPHGPVLIDTGQCRGVPETIACLRAAKIPPESLSLIVNTHAHIDHFGGNAALQELSGAPLACGPKTAALFDAQDTSHTWIDFFGVPEELLWDGRMVPTDRVLEPGETVAWGEWRFEVVAAPGHAFDSIALFDHKHRLLISADALHEKGCGILNTALHGTESIELALETVAQFRRLEPALILPGHGPAFVEVAESFDHVETLLTSFQRDPVTCARHLCARSFIYSLLLMQPVTSAIFLDYTGTSPWARHYAPVLGFPSGAVLAAQMLAQFSSRGVIEERDGMLVTTVLA